MQVEVYVPKLACHVIVGLWREVELEGGASCVCVLTASMELPLRPLYSQNTTPFCESYAWRPVIILIRTEEIYLARQLP